MQNHHLFGFGLLSLLLLNSSISLAETQNHIKFKVEIYKNPACSGKPEKVALLIDTSKSCNSYSYVDSKGLTTTGSLNNVRCFQDKVVYDQYPFSGKCLASESFYQGKQIVEKKHSVPTDVCQKDQSHDGPVYEKLTDYAYPGNENCTK